MTYQKLLRGLAGIGVISIILGACSKNTATQGVDTTTTEQVAPGSTSEPSGSPQSYAAPSATPDAQQDQSGVSASSDTQVDASGKGPQLSKKDDADSLNSDLNSTTIDTETFN